MCSRPIGAFVQGGASPPCYPPPCTIVSLKLKSRAHKLSLTNTNKLNVTNNNKLSITINNTAYTLSLYSRDNKMPLAHLSTMEVLVVLVESISNRHTSKPFNRNLKTTKCCPFFFPNRYLLTMSDSDEPEKELTHSFSPCRDHSRRQPFLLSAAFT